VFHLVGESQGSLLGRAIIEMVDNLGVQNFISMVGPQLGTWGIPFVMLPPFLRKLPLDEVSKLLYEKYVQIDLSFAEVLR